MPGFDRSGPMGEGPMTGGRRGLCVGETAEGRVPAGGGFGRGRGRGGRGGRGMGRGRGFGWGRPAVDPVRQGSQDDDLRRQVMVLSQRVAELSEQLARREASVDQPEDVSGERDADVS